MAIMVMTQLKTALESYAARDIRAHWRFAMKTYKLMRSTMRFFTRHWLIWVGTHAISLPVLNFYFASKTLSGLVTAQPILQRRYTTWSPVICPRASAQKEITQAFQRSTRDFSNLQSSCAL